MPTSLPSSSHEVHGAVRNQVAFHNSDADGLIEECFHDLGVGRALGLLPFRCVCQHFYYASELVVTRAMISIAMKHYSVDAREAFPKALDETLRVAREMTTLF